MTENGESVALIDKTKEFKRSFSDPSLIGLSRHIIELENCPPISVYVQGNLESGKNGPVFMTIHDVGSSFESMVDFVNQEDMAEVKSRCLFVHVSIQGQSHKAKDLTDEFPSLQNIGMELVTALDTLMIKEVVLIGAGAGAHIALRFGLCHPTRTLGLILVNCSASQAAPSFMEMIMEKIMGRESSGDEPQLNKINVEKYAEAYKNRQDLTEELSKIDFDVLLLNGSNCGCIEDTDLIYSKITPGKASIIKIDDVIDPLKEVPEKICDPIILFSQGLGWIPTAKRKCSIKSNCSSENIEGAEPSIQRRISMEHYDIPNIRRFSLEKH